MFHLKDGLFFGRTAAGDIRIVKTYDGRDIRLDNVVMDVTTDTNGFASIVATLSARGETGDTWLEAVHYLTRLA